METFVRRIKEANLGELTVNIPSLIGWIPGDLVRIEKNNQDTVIIERIWRGIG